MKRGSRNPVKRSGKIAGTDVRSGVNAVSQLVRALPKEVLVAILDREGRVVEFNRACRKMTGYSQGEVKGKRFWGVLSAPEERTQIKKSFGDALAGVSRQGQSHCFTKSRQPRLVSWSTALFRDGGTATYVVFTGVDVTEQEEARELARESSATVHALLESAPEAILAHNTKGEIVLANAAAEAMFGYKRREMIGHRLGMLIPKRFRLQHAKDVARFFQKPRVRPMGAGLNLFALRKGGVEFPADVGLSYFETRSGKFGVSFISDITERKGSEATLFQYQRELQALTARLLSVQEAGNKELARELHDDLSQKLAALAMEVSTLLQPSVKSPGSLPERIRSLSARINSLAEEVHALSRRLHPAILDELGLQAALREECLAFSAQMGVQAQFTSKNIPAHIPEGISLCLYRVAQESLRNIAKHSRATNIRVVLNGSKEGLTIRIQDSGDGFDPNEVKGKGGLGLISMEERVRLVDGKFTIRSKPGKGTTVEAVVPLKTK